MIRRVLAATVIAPVMALSALSAPAFVEAAPAAADCEAGGTSGCGDAAAKSSGTGYYSIPNTSCGAWVSTAGWGGACASPGHHGGGGGDGPPTWREIIRQHTDHFDPCRQDRLAPGFKEPPPPPHAEPGGDEEWLVEICMSGYDLDSIDGGDAIELEIRRVWDDWSPEPPWMDLIWGDVAANQSSFPYAMVNYGPHPYPVVNSPVFFTIDFQRFTQGGMERMGTREVVEVPLGTDMASGQTIYLVANASLVDIRTGDGGVVNCNDEEDRGAQFEVGEDTLDDFAETTKCKWTYEHSSAAQDGGTYDVVARVRWMVRYRIGDSGPRQELNPEAPTYVETEMRYQIPVQEVQVRDCVVADRCADG